MSGAGALVLPVVSDCPGITPQLNTTIIATDSNLIVSVLPGALASVPENQPN